MPITFLPLTSPVGKPYVPKRDHVHQSNDVASEGAFTAVIDPKSTRSDSEASDLNAPTQFRARTESS